MTMSTAKELTAIGVITTADGTLVLSDAVNLTSSIRAIRADVAGTVKITGYDGVAATLNFSAGETRNVGAVKVWATGTTATGLEGMV